MEARIAHSNMLISYGHVLPIQSVFLEHVYNFRELVYMCLLDLKPSYFSQNCIGVYAQIPKI